MEADKTFDVLDQAHDLLARAMSYDHSKNFARDFEEAAVRLAIVAMAEDLRLMRKVLEAWAEKEGWS